MQQFKKSLQEVLPMPIREYLCTKCWLEFERLFKTHEAEAAAGIETDVCPQCGHIARRIVSRTAKPQFKGDGFYETEYNKR